MFTRHFPEQIAAYLDRELAASEHVRVEAHLAQCPDCRDALEKVLMGRSIVRQLPLVKAPAGLWFSIEAAADEGRRRQPPAFAMWRYALATLVLAASSGALWNYWWKPTAQWEVLPLDGSPTAGTKHISAKEIVRTGQWIETDRASRARIKIGEIGSVDVQPSTRVRLVSTGAGGHRLALDSGGITAKISAPPRLFFVETPAGTAVDLGCEYDLNCDRSGVGVLRVSSGWVAFEWMRNESLVPAGASCKFRAGRRPGTPYFDDAPASLVKALDSFDSAGGGSGVLDSVLATARIRDTLTLWHLLSRVEQDDRSRIYDRIAALATPPKGITKDLIMRLDAPSLTRWREELAWLW